MRFSAVAAAAFLATVASAADYDYAPPSSSVVYEHETVTVNCKEQPEKCPYGGYKPTTKTSTTTVNLHPTGSYGNGSHPIQTPTYPISHPPYGGGDDDYDYKTVTTTICVPSTSTYVTKVHKPTTPTTYKPTGGPVIPPTKTGTTPPTYTGAASTLKMGSFAVFVGAAALILA